MFSKDEPICRLCLFADRTALVEIFERESEMPNSLDPSISLKIFSAFEYEVEKYDNLPKYICTECVQKLYFINQYNVWFKETSHQVSYIRSTLEAFHQNNSCDEDTKQLLILLSRRRNTTKSETMTHTSSLTSLAEALSCLIQNSSVNVAESDSSKYHGGSASYGETSQENMSYHDLQVKVHEYSTSFTTIAVDHMGSPKKVLIEAGNQHDQSSAALNSSDSEAADDAVDEENTCSTVKETQSSVLPNVAREDPPLESLTCPECQKPFKKKVLLCKHLMSHEGAEGKYQCQICKKIYTSTSDLNRHTRVHMGLKPYKCTKCSRFFSQKNLLHNHMNWHEGQKSHLCDICGHCFSSKSNLKTHVGNLHSAEKKKPFECKDCGKCFSRKHHLENHFNSHNKSRPHQCSVCGITFTRFSQLQEHENVHTGEKRFKCSDCNKSFRTKRVLNVHQLLHSGSKPHKCAVCKKSFTRRSGLQAHLKTHQK